MAGYLLEREMVSPRAVVDGGLRVVDASKLNRVFVVSAEGERGFVLKLAGDADDPGVAQEAAVLERLPPAPWRPRLVEYDAGAGVLIVEAAPGARDLARHHGAGRFPLGLAADTGRALGARLHASQRDDAGIISDSIGPRIRKSMTSRRYSDRCGCSKGARAPREQSCSVVAGSADVDHDSITMVIADDPARVAVEVREGIPVGGARPGGVVIAILEPSVQPETGQLVLGFESRPSAETVFGRLRGVASQQARVCSHRR